MVRQLTAIMLTDMVGYTALMQENEHLAKLNRDRHRAVLEDSIAEHVGRIFQFYGDGTLSVFRGAVRAVHAFDIASHTTGAEGRVSEPAALPSGPFSRLHGGSGAASALNGETAAQ